MLRRVSSDLVSLTLVPWVLGLLACLSSLGCGEGELDDPSSRTARGLASESQAIVGGYVDDETRGAVGLAINVVDIYFFPHCSGSLLSQNVVLTAQHCVSLTNGESPSGGVICGETDFGVTSGGRSMRVTVETVRPEQDGSEFYPGTGLVRTAPGTDNLCGFDVALIVLDGEGIPPAVATPLVPRIDSMPEPGEGYSAVGYGLTDPNEQGSSGTRMRIDDNAVSCVGEACGGGGSVAASEWSGSAPTCSGDSGGPAIDDAGRVMGVLSRGPFGCTSSVYGDVSSWGDWIIETTLEAADEAGIDPPYWATTGTMVPPPAAEAGEACIGVCIPGTTCARSRGQRVCVPVCDAASPCSSGWSCDEDLGACIQGDPPPAMSEDDSGCSVSGAPGSAPGRTALWGALLAIALCRRSGARLRRPSDRRRRRTSR